ncbi:hypothetical protein BT69DRAFT_1278090, partial [Atractiella rhizophila]
VCKYATWIGTFALWSLPPILPPSHLSIPGLGFALIIQSHFLFTRKWHCPTSQSKRWTWLAKQVVESPWQILCVCTYVLPPWGDESDARVGSLIQ